MIIFGTGSKDLGARRIPGSKCPSCQTKEIEIVGIAKYFHIFWIPVFPYSKKIIPVCYSCDLQVDKDDIDQRTTDKIKEEKKSIKMPFYLFSGLIIIALLIAYSVYSNEQHNKEIESNLANIQTSDVIVLKNYDNTYSYAKIVSISADTLFFNISNYVFEGGTPEKSMYKRDEAKHDDFFAEDVYYYRQYEIDSLRQAGSIYDLYREE